MLKGSKINTLSFRFSNFKVPFFESSNILIPISEPSETYSVINHLFSYQIIVPEVRWLREKGAL
jgi:hypothetical protein